MIDRYRYNKTKAVKSKYVTHVSCNAEVKFVNAVTAGGSVNFVASGVYFSRNNAVFNLNESAMYILS